MKTLLDIRNILFPLCFFLFFGIKSYLEKLTMFLLSPDFHSLDGYVRQLFRISYDLWMWSMKSSVLQVECNSFNFSASFADQMLSRMLRACISPLKGRRRLSHAGYTLRVWHNMWLYYAYSLQSCLLTSHSLDAAFHAAGKSI